MHSNTEGLTPQELHVIACRFGVGSSPLSHRPSPSRGGLDLGEERMDMIEAAALRKLRRMTLESFEMLRKAV